MPSGFSNIEDEFPKDMQGHGDTFIGLRYVKTAGTITMEGKYLRKADKEQLMTMGLGMQGQLRLKTDANVTGHNATRVIGKDERIYIWNIKDIHAPAPKLTISLN